MNSTQKKAIEVWGEQSQILKAAEECSELSAALIKYALRDVENRHKTPNLVGNIIEEIADCEIMIEQIKSIFNCNFQVKMMKKRKLERLDKLLKK